MVGFTHVGALGRGLALSLGVHALLMGCAYGLVRAAPRLTMFDHTQFVGHVMLAAVCLDFGWMLWTASLGMTAIRKRHEAYGAGLLVGAFARIAGYLSLR